MNQGSVFRFSVVLLAAILLLIGCKGSEDVKKDDTVNAKQLLSASENNFDPSKYDDPASVIINNDKNGSSAQPVPVLDTRVPSDTISGFRIQVLFTKEIGDANLVRDTLTAALPQEYVYVVYEAPYYKVRVGNFLDRATADGYLRSVTTKGFPDAWVVPDKVLTNLPPKPENK
ncbi:MAG TPA: SPOR domain-containing protein [Bacteroidota bacterium]|nr:SPOR domain-containing protein [Bacteroidota bacterium]